MNENQSSKSTDQNSSKIILSNDDTNLKNQNPKNQSLAKDLILQYVDDLQYKAILYEKELESYEQADFNFDSLLQNKEYEGDDEDDNVYVSKLMAKAKESLEQMSILNSKEFHHLEKTFDILTCHDEIIGKMNHKIHHFKHMDQI